jgi:hypothetical protein
MDADERIRVVIRNHVSGVEMAVLHMHEGDTIAQIKSQLSETQGTPKAHLRLVLLNRVLDDEDTMIGLSLPSELMCVQMQWKMDEETFEEGDLVQLHCDGNVVFDSLVGTTQEWIDSMDDMLGRTFQVVSSSFGSVSLPSPVIGGSHASPLVTFPDCVVRKGEVLVKDDIVKMNSSEDVVRHSFNSCGGYVWASLMYRMLGKEFPILEKTSRGIVALPSWDGSQGGRWYFPVSVVTKVTGDHEAIVRRSPLIPKTPVSHYVSMLIGGKGEAKGKGKGKGKGKPRRACPCDECNTLLCTTCSQLPKSHPRSQNYRAHVQIGSVFNVANYGIDEPSADDTTCPKIRMPKIRVTKSYSRCRRGNVGYSAKNAHGKKGGERNASNAES